MDNLYAVNEKGEIFWRVQSAKDAFNITQNTPYISMNIINSKIVQVTSFFGMRYLVEIRSSKLIDKECIGW